MRFQIFLVLLAALCLLVGVPAAEETQTGSLIISLEKPVHFTASDGTDIVAAPGTYRVEQAEGTKLKLVPVGEGASTRSAITVQAVAAQHEEAVSVPLALSFSEGQDEHHVVLLLSDGKGLDAQGTYSGVRSRAIRRPISSAVIRQQVVLKPSYATLTQLHLPDMVIVDVTGVPDAITSLDANGECPFFYATVTVKNTGKEDAWFPSNTWIIGGESQYTNIYSTTITNSQTTTRQAIRPNETWTAILAGKAKCLNGNPVTVTFEVDPQKRVTETNESNNLWSKSVPNRAVPNLDQKPDLIVQRVWFTPENPDHYSRVMINLELKNIGVGSAVFCQFNSIWMSQIEGQNSGGGGAGNRVVLPNEVIGGGLFISESGELQNGCYRVFVKVDPRNSIEESNENNNSYTAYLSIGGATCQDKIDEDRVAGTAIERIQAVPLRRISTDPMYRIP